MSQSCSFRRPLFCGWCLPFLKDVSIRLKLLNFVNALFQGSRPSEQARTAEGDGKEKTRSSDKAEGRRSTKEEIWLGNRAIETAAEAGAGRGPWGGSGPLLLRYCRHTKICVYWEFKNEGISASLRPQGNCVLILGSYVLSLGFQILVVSWCCWREQSSVAARVHLPQDVYTHLYNSFEKQLETGREFLPLGNKVLGTWKKEECFEKPLSL